MIILPSHLVILKYRFDPFRIRDTDARIDIGSTLSHCISNREMICEKMSQGNSLLEMPFDSKDIVPGAMFNTKSHILLEFVIFHRITFSIRLRVLVRQVLSSL